MNQLIYSDSKTILNVLRSAKAVRTQSQKIMTLAEEGKTHFEVHPDALPRVAQFVIEVMKERYPNGNIPLHSRWNHFCFEGIDRIEVWKKKHAHLSSKEMAKSLFDCVVISVLLDAGAGPHWRFEDFKTGKKVGRSEGLALATLEMFLDGCFSSVSQTPFQVDAAALEGLTMEYVSHAFQVSSGNPLSGLTGRHYVLQSLAEVLRAHPEVFGAECPRPANALDGFQSDDIEASDLLNWVLTLFSSLWPSGLYYASEPLGDVWHYPPLGAIHQPESFIPFHKISQWLTYSLIEPLRMYGKRVTQVHELTGLAEYRNGGLLLDGNVLTWRNPEHEYVRYPVHHPAVIEWRALTVILLDHLATEVRHQLGVDEHALSLSQILEGGTWQAGRKIAAQKRQSGEPSILLETDGTVF